ncbi:MAG: homoserine dehydrogenase [Bacteroidota bacterium]
MKQNKIKLGIFGFGCVGQGLYYTLEQTQGLKAEVVKICIKDRTKERSIPSHYFTFDKDEILDNPDINVVVELIDDPKAAYEIVVKALKSGKAVVTANKKMVADNFEELFKIQQEYNVPLLYESSCCASIPVIRNLEEYYDNDLINAVEGIFNGSSNYILTKIFNENAVYAEALKDAQEKGFAETNPILDVGGFDSKNKLCIIIAHAFGLFVKPEQIFNYGIQNINAFDVQYAREKGFRIRLVGFTRKVGKGVVGAVLPAFVKEENILYSINNEYNGVIVEGAFSENQFFLGKGAGSYPTGSAVLSDISALTYGYKYEYKKYHQNIENRDLNLVDDFKFEVYIRRNGDLKTIAPLFDEIIEVHRSGNINYLVGTISFSKLKSSGVFEDNDAVVILSSNNKIEIA